MYVIQVKVEVYYLYIVSVFVELIVYIFQEWQ